VRARHASLCGTGLHIAEDARPTARFPLAIGHEFVGVPPLRGLACLANRALRRVPRNGARDRADRNAAYATT
jgi:hypothetical protein